MIYKDKCLLEDSKVEENMFVLVSETRQLYQYYMCIFVVILVSEDDCNILFSKFRELEAKYHNIKVESLIDHYHLPKTVFATNFLRHLTGNSNTINHQIFIKLVLFSSFQTVDGIIENCFEYFQEKSLLNNNIPLSDFLSLFDVETIPSEFQKRLYNDYIKEKYDFKKWYMKRVNDEEFKKYIINQFKELKDTIKHNTLNRMTIKEIKNRFSNYEQHYNYFLLYNQFIPSSFCFNIKSCFYTVKNPNKFDYYMTIEKRVSYKLPYLFAIEEYKMNNINKMEFIKNKSIESKYYKLPTHERKHSDVLLMNISEKIEQKNIRLSSKDFNIFSVN